MQITDEEFESMCKVRKIIDTYISLLNEVSKLSAKEYNLLIDTLKYSIK